MQELRVRCYPYIIQQSGANTRSAPPYSELFVCTAGQCCLFACKSCKLLLDARSVLCQLFDSKLFFRLVICKTEIVFGRQKCVLCLLKMIYSFINLFNCNIELFACKLIVFEKAFLNSLILFSKFVRSTC